MRWQSYNFIDKLTNMLLSTGLAIIYHLLCFFICLLNLFSSSNLLFCFFGYWPKLLFFIGLACKERKSFVIATASDALWDTGKACGRIYAVRCIGDHPHPCQDVGPDTALLVKIADYCPNCRATMNLSEEAFLFLTNSTTYPEMIKIDYSAY